MFLQWHKCEHVFLIILTMDSSIPETKRLKSYIFEPWKVNGREGRVGSWEWVESVARSG